MHIIRCISNIIRGRSSLVNSADAANRNFFTRPAQKTTGSTPSDVPRRRSASGSPPAGSAATAPRTGNRGPGKRPTAAGPAGTRAAAARSPVRRENSGSIRRSKRPESRPPARTRRPAGGPADKQHDGEQISDAAALLYELHPAGDGCGRPRLSGRREGGIGEIDEHRQRKDHQPDPGERNLQIHRTTPAFTANSGSFAGLPWMAISARNSRRKASRSSDSVRCRWSVFARIASP